MPERLELEPRHSLEKTESATTTTAAQLTRHAPPNLQVALEGCLPGCGLNLPGQAMNV